MKVKELLAWFWLVIVVLIAIGGYGTAVCFFDYEDPNCSRYKTLGLTTIITAIILIIIYLIAWREYK